MCGAPPVSKWTCAGCTEILNIHRALIRNLQQWRSMYESLEVPDELIAADARSYSLWDVQRFYARRTTLPERQEQSIEWFLYWNLLEEDAASRMGIAKTNPVGVYATIGLTSLITQAVNGEIPGYVIELHGEERVGV